MTLRHLFDVCTQYPKIQNVLCLLFCITLRHNVVDTNSEMGISHFTLAKGRAAAIWFSCGSAGVFPAKTGLIYSHKKTKLLELAPFPGEWKK